MALNFPSSCRVGSWCDKETLRLHPGIHQLSERIFLFVSSRFSCFLTDHFCLFTTPNWLCVRRDDCQRLRSTPLPVWSDSNSLPADDWCVLIFLLTWQSDAADRLMPTRMTSRRKQHVTGVLRSRSTVTSCTGDVMLCLGGINLAWSQGKFRLVCAARSACIALSLYVRLSGLHRVILFLNIIRETPDQNQV